MYIICNSVNIFSITLINSSCRSYLKRKRLIKEFIVFHVNYREYIEIKNGKFYIEHNSMFHDIIFLIPLYNIIISTDTVAICYLSRSNSFFKNNTINKSYSYNNCIYFKLSYLKYLHLHSTIFRFCKFTDVYNKIKKNQIEIESKNICKGSYYKDKYSLVTTVYKRNNLQSQLEHFYNQSKPPATIIVIHDRNLVSVPYRIYNILYIHTINFPAGFYFRYLMALLSPENDILFYDDDWFPCDTKSHEEWIKRNQYNKQMYFGHHSMSKNGIRWCGTPLIIHRKWLYLIWYNKIYEPRAAEDGHLSFTLLLFCNIKCKQKSIKFLKYKYDNLSSSKINIKKNFWNEYTSDTKNSINSSYILKTKKEFSIF